MDRRLRISRRRLLGTGLIGGAVILTACGGPLPTSPPPAALAPAAPPVPGPASAPIVAPATSGDPLSAVAASPTRLAVAPTPTSVPVASAPSTAVPASPTVVASPTAIPPTETPTPIPVAYNETRLTSVLGESITSYAGSVPPRAHNVQLATRLINGAKVAPGAVFSFDATVGDQTTAHGFQVAWGIISNNGQPETVQADAGGICQVATTLFQSIYWAGLPLVRRFHHLYWIAHYGTPPYGGIGLDATVDFPPVDLQFKNTTSDWIRVDASYDSTHVHIQLRGASPGWLVTVGKPLIFNPVTVDRTIVRRGDPTMAPGTELTVEAAQDGFDVTLERLVKTKSGDLVDRYVFTNHYEPAHNVVVYGTKGLAPTPAVTITPTVAALTPVPATPTGSPSSLRLPDGRLKVPSLVGLPEASARQLVSNLGLQNYYTNYQGPGDVPAQALGSVPVGAVLSQMPAPGSVVTPGTIVYIAVRKA
jgi:hypothetical protein